MKKFILIYLAVSLFFALCFVGYAHDLSRFDATEKSSCSDYKGITTCGGVTYSIEWKYSGYCTMNHLPCCAVELTKFTTYKYGNVATPHKHYEYHDIVDCTFYVCPYGGPTIY